MGISVQPKNEELLSLIEETKQLSKLIADLKNKANKLAAGPEKENKLKEIKMRQRQALFYIYKMENVSKEIKYYNM
jgi:hypothetical protein